MASVLLGGGGVDHGGGLGDAMMCSGCPHRIETDGMTTYTWRGEPISDIHAWATQHREQLIKYRHECRYLSPVTGHEYLEISHGIIPKTWFESMRLCGGEQMFIDGDQMGMR